MNMGLLYCILPCLTVIQFCACAKNEGDACLKSDKMWYSIATNQNSFIYCHPKHGVYVREDCATVNGLRKVFVEAQQQCINKDIEILNDPGHTKHSLIGDICFTDANCPSNAHCDPTGICQCKTHFVRVKNLCLSKIQLDKNGCIHNAQCSAIWPGAYCGHGICKCPNDTFTINTSDGVFCSKEDECPTGGLNVHLGGSENCQHNQCTVNGSSVDHLFQCIKGKENTHKCCPNKAFTCMQPAMAGNGNLRLKRFFYNPIDNKCQKFMYTGGSLVNSNVFETEQQCLSYCQIGCPRGVPYSHSNQQVSCKLDDDCPNQYACTKNDDTKNNLGLCCPIPAWICSPEGGVSSTKIDRETEFETGSNPIRDSVFYPVIRYYFSTTQGKCKAFLYRGEGGNFNNFLTEDHCRDFCSSVMCNGNEAGHDESGHLVLCNQASDVHCPDGYICSPPGVCCPLPSPYEALQFRPTAPQCPAGSEPMYVLGPGAFQSSPIVPCDIKDPCPPSYTCELSFNFITQFPRGICCRRNRYFGSNLNKSLGSTTHTVTTTMETTTIQPTTEKNIVDVISPLVRVCPGQRHHLSNTTGVHQCMLSDITSPDVCDGYTDDYVCSFASINSTSGYCCSMPTVDQFRCPPNMFATTRNDSSSLVQLCSPYVIDACPDGAWCVYDELYGTYHCCQHQSHGCPAGMIAARNGDTNDITSCSPADQNACSPGYQCQYSYEKRIFQCCGVPAACPANRVAYMDPVKSVPFTCNEQSLCPHKFTCIFQDNSTDGICCSRDAKSGLCGNGDALVDEFGSAVQCLTLQCPAGFKCTNISSTSLCCPQPDHLCNLPLDVGHQCSQSSLSTQFAFDPQSNTCKAFIYKGCGGNENNFISLEYCDAFCHVNAICPHGVPLADTVKGGAQNCNQSFVCQQGFQCMHTTHGNFCCPQPELVCKQSLDPGVYCSGGVNQKSWYYDANTASCTSFVYHGCGANMNIFNSEAECQEFCSPTLCLGSVPERHNKELVICNDSTPCSNGFLCNNSSLPHPVCCKTNGNICSQPQESGTPCGVPHIRYSYEWSANKCNQFLYYGCDGTDNNFASLEECLKFCRSDISTKPVKCPSGGIAFIPTGKTYATECVPEQNACPNKFDCQATSVGSFHCCPGADFESACPQGSRPFVDSQSPYKCNPNKESCPFGYSCTYNAQFKNSYCCTHPFVSSNTISFSQKGIMPGFSACSDGSVPYLEPHTSDVRICSPYLTFSCPTDYKCQYNNQFVRYQCCQNQKEQTAGLSCPSGLHPYLHPSNHSPIICQPGVSGFCPFTSMCQYSTLYWQFICCSNALMAAPLYDIQPINTQYWQSANRVIRPGETGCVLDADCSASYHLAYCQESMCICPFPMSIYKNICVYGCPKHYIQRGRYCSIDTHYIQP